MGIHTLTRGNNMSQNNLALVAQLGATLLPDTKTHVTRTEIRSETSNRLYIVSQAAKSGEWQCSCPGWIYKKAGQPRACKHLSAMVPLLTAGATPAAAVAAPKAEAKLPSLKVLKAAPAAAIRIVDTAELLKAFQEALAEGGINTEFFMEKAKAKLLA